MKQWNYLKALNKITEDNNDENVLHWEITESVLVHCNIVSYDYHMIHKPGIHLLPINHLLNY